MRAPFRERAIQILDVIRASASATREAPHRYLYIDTYIHMCGTREDAPTDYQYVRRVPSRNPRQTQGLPQAEFRPGRLPSSRITTREPTHKQNYDQGTGWLAGWRNYERLAGWLAGGLAGWLRPSESQRGPERRSMYRTSLSCAWLEAPHKQIYDQGGSPQISIDTYISLYKKQGDLQH